MISAQDIENQQFDRALHGYRMADVDEFMSLLKIDYEKLWSENATLKSKMGVLVEKIQEYREVEESLRKALLSAQKMSETITNEAKREGEYIVSTAKERSERIINAVNLQIISEKRKLEEVKRETQVFKGRLISLYRSQMTMLETIPDLDFKEFIKPEDKRTRNEEPAAVELQAKEDAQPLPDIDKPVAEQQAELIES